MELLKTTIRNQRHICLKFAVHTVVQRLTAKAASNRIFTVWDKTNYQPSYIVITKMVIHHRCHHHHHHCLHYYAFTQTSDIRLPLSLSLKIFVSREFQRKVIVKMFALGVVMVGKLFFFTLISWMGLNISLSQPSQPSLAVRRAKIENAKPQAGKIFTRYRFDEKGKDSINISGDM